MEEAMIPIVNSDIDGKALNEMKDYLGRYIDNVYYLPNSPLIPFCYFEDFLWIHLFNTDVGFMKSSRLKDLIQQRKAQIEHSLEKKDYHSLLSMTENIIKIEMFIKYFHDIPDKDKYDIFRNVYQKSEYNFRQLEPDFLENVFSYRRESKKWVKNMKLLRTKVVSDGWLVVYRGEGSKSSSIEDALSWSLDKETAEFFANRFDETGVLYQAKVHIDNVLDYIDERNEEEVLVDFQDLTDITELCIE